LIDVPGKLFNPEEVSKFARSCFLERIGTCWRKLCSKTLTSVLWFSSWGSLMAIGYGYLSPVRSVRYWGTGVPTWLLAWETPW
jgi:hypothetical protein